MTIYILDEEMKVLKISKIGKVHTLEKCIQSTDCKTSQKYAREIMKIDECKNVETLIEVVDPKKVVRLM